MHEKAAMLVVLGMVGLPGYAIRALPASLQTPHVVSTSPAKNELSVLVCAKIWVTFDMEMVQLPLPRRSVSALGQVVCPASDLYRNGPPPGCP